jgi:hypothetical protein
MAKEEFNGKSVRDRVREILGLPPAPPMTEEERAEAELTLHALRRLRARDPDFKQAARDWVEAEAQADPDAFDDLTPEDMQRQLQKAATPKSKPPRTRRT